MKAIKIFTIVLAIIFWGCEPVEIPNDTQKPGIEKPEDGEEENPGDTEDPDGEEPGTEEPGNQEPQESYYVKVVQSLSDWSGDYTCGSGPREERRCAEGLVGGGRVVELRH